MLTVKFFVMSADLICFFAVIFVVLPYGSEGITYQENPQRVPAAIPKTQHEEELLSVVPINNTQLERQRRLIPYMTFYLTRNLNRPQTHQPTQQQTHQTQTLTHYRLVPQKILVHPQQSPTKFIIANYRPNSPEPQIIYEQKLAYTPFLESNKLPGGFTPIRSPQPIRIHVVSTPPEPPVTKEPNYGVLFDKLVQLKQLEFTKTTPYVIPLRQTKPSIATQYFTRNFQTPRPPPKIISMEEYEQSRPKAPEPVKTYIHTYTPSNIDIPSDAKVKNIENFESLKTYNQIPPPETTPVKTIPVEINYQHDLPQTKPIKPILFRPVYRPTPFAYPQSEIKTTPNYETSEPPTSLSAILKQLQDSNTLPQTLTPDNIDNSIKTLVQILNELKQTEKFQRPIVVEEGSQDHSSDYDEDVLPESISQTYPVNTPEGGTPGKPGVDYPAYSLIPQTSFNCKKQRYKGFFGDPDTNCQVWHYCDLNGGQASFLCPNGTIFSQVALTCDWWYNVKCDTTTQLYVLNERLYKYILPFTPKFPEDYSGPLVDRYLALKFKEMEEKMKKQKKGKVNKSEDPKDSQVNTLEDIENGTGSVEYTTESNEQNEQTTK